jgi:hypothetical protein
LQAVDEPPNEKIDSVRVDEFLDDHDGVRMGTGWAVSGRAGLGRETRVPYGWTRRSERGAGSGVVVSPQGWVLDKGALVKSLKMERAASRAEDGEEQVFGIPAAGCWRC